VLSRSASRRCDSDPQAVLVTEHNHELFLPANGKTEIPDDNLVRDL
jgi:hypothetical protein